MGVRRPFIEHLETFSLLAELALGLAGFTGVAAAFGGSARTYGHSDHLRLVGIFMTAGSVLVGCLVILALQSAAATHSNTYFFASATAAVILAPNIYPLIPGALVLVRDPETSTGAWVFLIIMTQFVVSSSLLVVNLVVWRAAWPLIAAFSIQLAYGLFLFARMLTVRK